MSDLYKIYADKDWVKEQIKQPDWGQNDETQPDYVKNRTHYTSVENVTVIERGVIAFEEMEGLYGAILPEVSFYTITNGDEFNVTWDDENVTTTAIDASERAGSPTFIIGNGALAGLGEDNGLNFIIMLGIEEDGTKIAVIGTTSTTSEHIIEVSYNAEIIHKMPIEYIPELPYVTEGRLSGSDIGEHSYALGFETTASGLRSHAEGYKTTASGESSHAEGSDTTASGSQSHAEGSSTEASGEKSHAEGQSTTASGESSHAEGLATKAIGHYSHAEGVWVNATEYGSHAEGHETTASGTSSHAEGHETTASGSSSHAEGDGTTASGTYSHAEGYKTIASGNFGSHAEGWATTAIGQRSHAEGDGTTASAPCSHAEGYGTTASGSSSHAEGEGTIASGDYSHAEGRYNVEDTSRRYAHIVGNGFSGIQRSNAHTLDWNGNAWFQGEIKVGGTEQDDAAAKTIATEEYVITKVTDLVNSAPETLDTLGELATALQENKGVTDALDAAIGNKANASDLNAHIGNKENPHNVTAEQIGAITEETDPTVPSWAKQPNKPSYTATEVGADPSGTASTAVSNHNSSTAAHSDIRTEVGKKANASDLTSHTGNTSNPHNVTKAQVGLGNVENKSSATIRGELTKANVTTALGYTPPTQDTTYGAAGTDLGLVKSGGDVTISSGVITINDDSHNHTIANVDGLQTAIDGKAPTSHASTATTYGAASASNYGHAMASSTTPKANGTAAIGSETAKFARGDHVHPLQTSVSGSAGSVAWSGVTSKPSYYDAKAIKSISRSGTTFTYTCMDNTTGTFDQQDNNTTYSAGDGISLSGTTFSNSGVRSVTSGSTNGTISVNTNGTSIDVAVNGLGSAAYTQADDYARQSHTHEDAVRYYNDVAAFPLEEDFVLNAHCITYGNGRYVTVNDRGETFYSDDGINWLKSNNLQSIKWRHIAYGNNMFVAVGLYINSLANLAYASSSTDGITWKSTFLPEHVEYGDICYGNGKFILLPKDETVNAVMYSTDGTNWQKSSIGYSAEYTGIAYNGNKFVACQSAWGTISTSIDGVTWEPDEFTVSDIDWSDITYGNGKFVAISGGNSNIATYSTGNGVWEETTLPIYANWSAVTYGNGVFVAIASKSDKVAYSADGITWSLSTLPASKEWSGIVYGDDKFVAIAANYTHSIYSADGIHWATERVGLYQDGEKLPYDQHGANSKQHNTLEFISVHPNMPSLSNFGSLKIASGNGKTVIMGYDPAMFDTNYIVYSDDNLVFTPVNLGDNNVYWWHDIVFAYGKFVMVGCSSENGGTVFAHSEDAENWTVVTLQSIDRTASRTMEWGGCLGNIGGAYTLYDGSYCLQLKDFTESTTEYWTHRLNLFPKSIATGCGSQVIVGGNSSNSSNPVEFCYRVTPPEMLSCSMPGSLSWSSVTFGNDTFVAVGQNTGGTNTLAAYSEDEGVTWNGSQLPIGADWSSVAYGNGKFVAVQSRCGGVDSNVAAYSTNGVHWTQTTMPVAAGWVSVTFFDDKFVAVSSDNDIAFSFDGVYWYDSLDGLFQNGHNVTDTIRALLNS